MRLNKAFMLPALAIAALLASTVALAQGGYSLPWWRSSAGGGVSSAGEYTLSGAIGQAEAGGSVGGGYSLSGGFWGAAAAPDVPELGGQVYLPVANRNPPTPIVIVTPTPVTPTVAQPKACGDEEKNNNIEQAANKPLLVLNAPCTGTLAGDEVGDDYFRLNRPAGTVVRAIIVQVSSGTAKGDLIEGTGKKYGPVALPFTLRANYNYYVRVRSVANATDYLLRVNIQ